MLSCSLYLIRFTHRWKPILMFCFRIIKHSFQQKHLHDEEKLITRSHYYRCHGLLSVISNVHEIREINTLRVVKKEKKWWVSSSYGGSSCYGITGRSRRHGCWGCGCSAKAPRASPALAATTPEGGRRGRATSLLPWASPPSEAASSIPAAETAAALWSPWPPWSMLVMPAIEDARTNDAKSSVRQRFGERGARYIAQQRSCMSLRSPRRVIDSVSWHVRDSERFTWFLFYHFLFDFSV